MRYYRYRPMAKKTKLSVSPKFDIDGTLSINKPTNNDRLNKDTLYI